MNFQFESFGEFLAMNGHGPYVWACFALTFALMLYLAFAPDMRVRQFVRQQKRLERRVAAARGGELESS